MERFGGFESRFERSQTPEGRFRELARREAERIRWETRDSLAQEVVDKILFKLDLKDRLAEVDRYRDNPSVYQNLKRLGLFLVFDRTAQHEWKDESSSFCTLCHKLKVDLGDSNRFDDLGELIAEIYQTIHLYNTERIHAKLKMPPNQFDQMRQLLTTNSLSVRP